MKIRSALSAAAAAWLENNSRRNLLSHPEIKSFLENVISPSTGCSYSDYWLLYSYVVKHKPKEVLELGSGISTAILGFAAQANGVTRITSMDESETYLAATRKIIPESLLPSIDLRYSKSVDFSYGPFVGVSYENIPDREYDFVFVDGPQYDPKTSFDADIIKLAQRQDKPFTYVVDSRTGSCLIYHLAFKDQFRFDYLKRKGIGRASRNTLRTYPEMVAWQMKRRAFPRAFV